MNKLLSVLRWFSFIAAVCSRENSPCHWWCKRPPTYSSKGSLQPVTHAQNTRRAACWGRRPWKCLAMKIPGSCSRNLLHRSQQNSNLWSCQRRERGALDRAHRLEFGAPWFIGSSHMVVFFPPLQSICHFRFTERFAARSSTRSSAVSRTSACSPATSIFR